MSKTGSRAKAKAQPESAAVEPEPAPDPGDVSAVWRGKAKTPPIEDKPARGEPYTDRDGQPLTPLDVLGSGPDDYFDGRALEQLLGVPPRQFRHAVVKGLIQCTSTRGGREYPGPAVAQWIEEHAVPYEVTERGYEAYLTNHPPKPKCPDEPAPLKLGLKEAQRLFHEAEQKRQALHKRISAAVDELGELAAATVDKQGAELETLRRRWLQTWVELQTIPMRIRHYQAKAALSFHILWLAKCAQADLRIRELFEKKAEVERAIAAAPAGSLEHVFETNKIGVIDKAIKDAEAHKRVTPGELKGVPANLDPHDSSTWPRTAYRRADEARLIERHIVDEALEKI